MAKERFELTPGNSLMWTVKDNESGVKIEFREGLFNDTQVVHVPSDFDTDYVLKMARIMREIGEWMSKNHAEVALCEWDARRSAIWKLSKDIYWVAMAAATSSLLLSDLDAKDAAYILHGEVCDWIDLEKSIAMTYAEEENLKGVLTLLTAEEAWEVFKILHVFWNYKENDGDMWQWGEDVTWWPVWIPRELKLKDLWDDDEDDIIDEK